MSVTEMILGGIILLVSGGTIGYFLSKRKRQKNVDEANQVIGASTANDENREEIKDKIEERIEGNNELIEKLKQNKEIRDKLKEKL